MPATGGQAGLRDIQQRKRWCGGPVSARGLAGPPVPTEGDGVSLPQSLWPAGGPGQR